MKYLLLIFYLNEAQMSLLNERKTADILGIITADFIQQLMYQ